MQRILRAILLILCLPLIALLALLVAPAIFVIVIWQFIWVVVPDLRKRREFLRRNRGVFFLVLTRRHDWEPFLENNLVPIIEEVETKTLQLIQIHWFQRRVRRSSSEDHFFPSGIAKPYLLRFHKYGYQLESLHDELLKFKEERQASSEVSQTVRRLLVRKINKLVREKPGAD